jgi:hypothetical protein
MLLYCLTVKISIMQVYVITSSYGCCIGIETVSVVKVPAAKEAAFKKQYENRILATGSQAKALAIELGLKYKPPGV